MSSICKVFILGRVGKDPSKKETDNTTICSFPVATSRKYKGSDGQVKEETEWHSIVCFGNSADFASNHVSKGDVVHIEGYLKTRKWTGSDGNDRYVTEVIANSVTRVASAKKGNEVDSETPF